MEHRRIEKRKLPRVYGYGPTSNDNSILHTEYGHDRARRRGRKFPFVTFYVREVCSIDIGNHGTDKRSCTFTNTFIIHVYVGPYLTRCLVLRSRISIIKY